MASPVEEPCGQRWPVFLVTSGSSPLPRLSSSLFIKRDPAQVERQNLVNLCKLIVKELIDSSVQYGRQLDSDFLPLQHFFIVLEHALRHGLRPKKGLLGPKKELWDLLQLIEKYNQDAHDITTSVRDLPTVKTSLGRARAWIRLALMQKKLADYLKVLFDQRENGILLEFYEPGALLLSDESVVLLGLLLGLNVVDCNLCLKEEDLDSQQGVIDFSLYLRSGNNNTTTVTETVESASMTAVLDQKNYVEELNRHLSATITNLQSRLDQVTTSHTLMKEELALTKLALEKEQEENRILRGCTQSERSGTETPEMEPLRVERSSNSKRPTSAYLANEDAVAEVKMQLAEEKNRRLDLEKELELQTCMRAETEVALKLLEKDIHEKQDTIVSLRRQLDDIKIINLEMYRKLQDAEKAATQKSDYVAKLEKEIAEAVANLHAVKEQLEEAKTAQRRSEDNSRRSMEECMELQSRCRTLEEDLRLEKEWRQSLQDSIVTDRSTMAEMQRQMEEVNEISNVPGHCHDFGFRTIGPFKLDSCCGPHAWSRDATFLSLNFTLPLQEYSDLREKHQRLLKLCTEQEKTLEEVGCRLRDTKLEADNLKESAVWVTRDAQWARDEEVSNCRLCDKEFNLSRRKHHCRNCGEIYCAACSDNTMPLPSSAKPVRVCDTCHTRLLQRYSAAQ